MHGHNEMQSMEEQSEKDKCQTHRHNKVQSKSSERRRPTKAKKALKCPGWLLARNPKKMKILEPIILSLLNQTLAMLQPR
jgi:hypothetical protein